ncbi:MULTISPECIES: hypothetical protein [unclassified Bradyrhizobium]|uniref:hypothetical protein n=1 Tax=unclassified Bradyrhizobium TaxID=2631580 RepID=UPI0028E9D6C6|nr:MULTISPECIES: hypothetical protein [unclassified Bradyrhizobium]
MSDKVTAFRLFGDFNWPPLPKGPSLGSSVSGVVEIHYVHDAATNKNVACVRWLPRTALDTSADGSLYVSTDFPDPSTIEHLDALNDVELAQRLTDSSKPIAFWVGGTTHQGVRLAFRGAFLLDQFPLNDSSNFNAADLKSRDPLPDRRFPLVRYIKLEEKDYYSQLLVGQPTTDYLRLDLALPSAVPQFKGQQEPYFFPFSALYEPHIADGRLSRDTPAAIKVFVAGLSERGFSTEQVDIGQGKAIGDVNFCKDGSADGYVAYPTKNNNPASNFWPSQIEVVCDALGRAGFAVDGPLDGKIFLGADNERSLGLRFGGQSGYGVAYTYRLGLGWNNVGLDPQPPNRAYGDLEMRGGLFLLRFGVAHTDWLDTQSRHLYIDYEFRFSLASSAIWAWREGVAESGPVSKALVRIGFTQSLDSDPADTIGESINRINALTIGGLLRRTVKAMRLARISLGSVTPERPRSFLPELRVKDTGDKQFALLALLPVTLDTHGVLSWGTLLPKVGKVQRWQRPEFRLSLADDGYYPPRPKARVITLEAKLSFFRPSGGTFDPDLDFDQAFDINLAHDGNATSGSPAERGVMFRIVAPPDGGTRAFDGQLGGLRLTGLTLPSPTSESGKDVDYAFLRIGRRKRIDPIRKGNSREIFDAADIDIRWRIATSKVEPIATDRKRGDRTGRAQPLLINLNESAQAVTDNKPFLIDIRETLSGESDWRLTVQLVEQDQSVFSDEAGGVLVSTEPFSLLRFYSRPAGSRGDAGNSIVASYDSDTGQWQFKRVSDYFHYALPPQSIGESMDKPRRLEIHDAGDPGAAGFLRPYPDSSTHPDPDDPQYPQSGLRRHAVEFRLTPSAELWVRSSDVERGFLLPEWATYDIFRQKSELGLGAAIDAFRAEFLYGLPVGVLTSDETGPARRARIAEIEALTGRPVADFTSSNPSATLRARWQQLRGAIARRQERLELWADDPQSNIPFAPASFEKGVRFALRETALHRPPVAELDPPVTGDGSWAESAGAGVPGVPRLHSRGLSGGALWPFESRNVFQSLLDNPGATGGKIEKVAFSALGGDADQKAEFRNGIISIISETRNGFVQRHKVEVLGRIGVFWHRAKHVVVYERTVNPTAQFTPEYGFETRTRRPVLRKVSEYVELLQPERFYPDKEAAELRTSGCLRSLRFNSKIINVDSAWSEDVADYGWKIPLWNHLGARQRPQVYPRPDIAFVTQAEGEGDDPLAAQECINPDNLYFFTDTKTKSSDTDSWVPRNSIDCADLPAPSHAWQADNSDDGNSSTGNDAQARAKRIPRGHHRFTWRLAPPARRTTINGGRSATPLYAALDTITFMRSAAETDPQLKAGIAPFAQLSIDAKQLGSYPGFWKKGEKLEPGAIASDVATSLAEFTNLMQKNPSFPTDGAVQQAIRDRAAELKGKLTALAADDRLKKAKETADKIKEAVSKAGKLPATGKSICDKFTDDYAGALQRKKLILLENVRSAQHDVLAELDRFNADPTRLPDKAKLKEWIVNSAVEAIRPVFVQVSADIGNVKRAAESGRAAIRDFAHELSDAFDKAARDIDTCRQSYDDSKPWSEGRLLELQRKINTVPQRLALNLGPAIDDAHRRMAIDVGDMGQDIANFAARALGQLQAQNSQFTGALANAELDIGGQIGELESRIDGAHDGLVKGKAALEKAKQGKSPDIVAKIDELIKAADAINAKAVEVKQSAEAAKADLHAFAATLADTLSKLAAAVRDISEQVTAFTRQLASALQDFLKDVADTIKGEIGDVSAALTDFATKLSDSLVAAIKEAGAWPDALVGAVQTKLCEALGEGQKVVKQGFSAIDDVAADLDDRLSKVNKLASPDYLVDQVLKKVIDDAAVSLLNKVDDSYFAAVGETEQAIEAKRAQLRNLVNAYEQEFENKLDQVGNSVKDVQKEIHDACGEIAGGLDRAEKYLTDEANKIVSKVEQQAKQFADDLVDKLNDYLKPDKYGELLTLADRFDNDIRKVGNDFARTRELAAGYGERVLDAAANVTSGGVLAAPNNVLKLYAAVASAPEMPNLDYSRERIGYYFKQIDNVINTTPVEAWFGRMGDALKALGLSLPVDKIGDRLVPIDLSKLDISRIFRNFGGVKLDKLFPGFRMPSGSGDGIRISHAFDKKAFRAWVQIDVNVPIPGRNSMFTIGPFKLDAVDSNFVGAVRIEASKDTDTVEQTGHARLGTRLEAVIAGEQMVAFRDVGIVFARDSGLKVEFDPKKIELSAVFQFIQNTLGAIFGDQVGGLKIVKLGGIPIGVSHDFSLPPMSLMFGTSGVTNIQISNHFELVAYPDFIISDRFSLAKPELPFIFSVFIIGGTGYLSVEVEYRPFKNELMVTVEAAAGGSASLGFAFAGCTGSVMITISVALTYRKLIGHSGGGLTISLVVLIAGNVDILGIATVYIGIMLRLSYRDTGDIDAYGTLIVSLRITRFFKITVRRDVTYHMSGGRSTTTTSGSTKVESPVIEEAANKVRKLAGGQH